MPPRCFTPEETTFLESVLPAFIENRGGRCKYLRLVVALFDETFPPAVVQGDTSETEDHAGRGRELMDVRERYMVSSLTLYHARKGLTFSGL